mgnify:CR=1 FL=1
MDCEYVKNYYQVPACIGRRVEVEGKPGIIAADRGHYIGVNFDEDKPGVIRNCHPTWQAQYLELGEIRNLTKSQERYKRFLEYGDGFHSFIDYCRWDADPDRTWNGGIDREYLINRSFADSQGCY